MISAMSPLWALAPIMTPLTVARGALPRVVPISTPLPLTFPLTIPLVTSVLATILAMMIIFAVIVIPMSVVAASILANPLTPPYFTSPVWTTLQAFVRVTFRALIWSYRSA